MAYIQKLTALQTNDHKGFGEANEKLLSLLNEENEGDIPAIVFHSLGKEMYKVGLNSLGSKNKRQRASLMTTAFSLFSKAAARDFRHSHFYLGEMLERGDAPGGTALKQAVAAYERGAAQDDARCLFQLVFL
jgi:TPR repeat protein